MWWSRQAIRCTGSRNEENPLGCGGALSQRNDQPSAAFCQRDRHRIISRPPESLHPIGDLLPREKAIHAGREHRIILRVLMADRRDYRCRKRGRVQIPAPLRFAPLARYVSPTLSERKQGLETPSPVPNHGTLPLIARSF